MSHTKIRILFLIIYHYRYFHRKFRALQTIYNEIIVLYDVAKAVQTIKHIIKRNYRSDNFFPNITFARYNLITKEKRG